MSLLALGLLALLVAACGGETTQRPTGDTRPPGFFPGEVVTEQGRLAADLYVPIFVIATIVFVLVEGLLIFIAFRYRRRPAQEGTLPVQTHGNNRLEIAWTIIPAVVVTVLFAVTLLTLFRIDARAASPGATIDVTGFQWQWTFEYPEYTAADGEPLGYTGAGTQGPEMVVPLNEPVRVRLHSQDVIHSFYVPQTFYKRDVIPGRINEFDMTFVQAGTFGGQCAEFCGLAHSEMFFTVRAVPRPEFDAWVDTELQQANASPAPAASGAPASGGPPGGQLEISTPADDPLAFDPTTLSAPAGAPVTVVYHNASDLPHNIAFFEGGDPSAPRIGGTEVAAGPGDQTATFEAPAPGSYYFHCDVHPQQMNGTFEVTP